MSRTELLKQDHEQLRHRLAVLEGALQGVRHPEIVRTLCHSLGRVLTQHIQREDGAFAPCAHRVEPSLKERLLHDHADEQALLQDLNALFDSRIQMSTGAVMCHLAHLVEEVREHMEVEEYDVFPVIECADEELRPRLAAVQDADAGEARCR